MRVRGRDASTAAGVAVPVRLQPYHGELAPETACGSSAIETLPSAFLPKALKVARGGRRARRRSSPEGDRQALGVGESLGTAATSRVFRTTSCSKGATVPRSLAGSARSSEREKSPPPLSANMTQASGASALSSLDTMLVSTCRAASLSLFRFLNCRDFR